MTVRQLINELLDKPMDAEIVLAVQDMRTYEYLYRDAFAVVHYDDGSVGIIDEQK